MSSVLALARDFIERMCNPVFGLSTNEEYSLQFGQLLQTEEFGEQLRRDVESLQDPGEMTSHGWIWLLGWARANRVVLENELLVKLFDQWSSVFMKAAIIDLATQLPDGHQVLAERQRSDVIENPFVADIVSRAMEYDQSRERLDRDVTPIPPPLGRSEATLTALLQVGRPATIRGAQALLRRHWPGQEQLVEYFWSLADSLEDETRAAWLREINPPPRRSSRM